MSLTKASRNFQLMIISISWIWWVVWSGVWKCQQLVLSSKYWNNFLVLKIGHLDMYILHSKCEKFPTIFVSFKIYSKDSILLDFPSTLVCTHFFNQNQKRGNLSFFPNEIWPKLWKLIGSDKTEWFFEEKISNSDFFSWFMDSKSGCRGKLEKNQFVR